MILAEENSTIITISMGIFTRSSIPLSSLANRLHPKIFRYIQKSLDYFWVKIRTGVFLYDFHRLLVGKRLLIRALGNKSVVYVRDSHDPPFNRNFLPGKFSWIPCSVPFFVMVARKPLGMEQKPVVYGFTDYFV